MWNFFGRFSKVFAAGAFAGFVQTVLLWILGQAGLFRLLSDTGRSEESPSQNEKENQRLPCPAHSRILISRFDVAESVAWMTP